MRILLLNQFFWPDSAATSQLLTDVARHLVKQGHEVHVICADSGYAPEDSTDPPGAVTHRAKTSRFVRGILGRVTSYGSFFLGCAWRGVRIPRPDIVLTLTTPPLLSLVGTLIKAVRGSRHFIWEMDLYPDVAVDLSYFRSGGVLDRAVGLLADFSRKRSDGILVLGTCMRDRLIKRGIDESKVLIAENWADSAVISPVPWPREDEPLRLLYSGNLGLAHDTDAITAAMLALKDDERFQFIFAGGGARRTQVEVFCAQHQISSALFKPYSAKSDLGVSLGSGHIGLITQRDECLGSVVPSKMYGLLAAGRPILFVGPKKSTIARNIERFQCGWQVEPGDGRSLLAVLRYLASHRSEIYHAGVLARQAFLQHFDLAHGVARISALLGASEGEAKPHTKQSVTMASSYTADEGFAKV